MIKLLDQLKNQRIADRQQQQREQLIRREAVIGGELFGPVPKKSVRSFFNINHNTWIWHEEWVDKDGQRRMVTTRYEIRPNGVLKAQDGHSYHYIDVNEARNLYNAIQTYYKRAMHEIYGLSV
jgi:hypothetical protein